MEEIEKNELVVVAFKATKHLNEAIEKAVRVNAHVTKSDFCRDVIREKLKQMGLLD